MDIILQLCIYNKPTEIVSKKVKTQTKLSSKLAAFFVSIYSRFENYPNHFEKVFYKDLFRNKPYTIH